MTHHEGILVTWNEHINASAAGADIEGHTISLDIYRPSDAAENLTSNDRFTFSLTDDPRLFFQAALTGHNSGKSELDDRELHHEEEFWWPKNATSVHLCSVEKREETKMSDEYGETRLLAVKGTIEERRSQGPYIERENPLVDAMVHASRLHVAEGMQKEKLKEKIKELLKNEDGKVVRDIIDYVEDIT